MALNYEIYAHGAKIQTPNGAFGCQWIIEAGLMDSKSGLGAAGDREMGVFKFSPLTVLAWAFCVHFGGF